MTVPPLYDVHAQVALLDGLYPRLVGLIDRDPDSPTYGSCDREFWMYRLHDFESGVLQQAGLTLAALSLLVESVDVGGCRYLHPRHAASWRTLALAVNRRTVRLLADGRGMLDEYYPGERSFPGTVFAAYATLKSALLLGQDEIVRSAGLQAAARALSARTPSAASNQDAAAAAFLALHARGGGAYAEAARRTASALLGGPREHGSFLEYGGIDLGYGSVTLHYLAAMDADGSQETTAAVRRLGAQLGSFVTPAGRFGGEFASRSTTYVLPFGLVEAARHDPALARRYAPLDLAAAFAKLDDRYLMHYCAPSLAMAAWRLAERGAPPMAAPDLDDTWRRESLPDGHLHAFRRGRTAVFVGLNKGGAFQVEVDGRTTIDCGYRASVGEEVFGTCVVDDAAQPSVTESAGAVELRVRARFLRYRVLVPTAFSTVVLRLLRLAGPMLNALFKNLLIKKPQVLAGLVLDRRLRLDLETGQLTVDDVLETSGPAPAVRRSPAASFRLVPSAKFHQAGEEDAAGGPSAVRFPDRRVFPLHGTGAER